MRSVSNSAIVFVFVFVFLTAFMSAAVTLPKTAHSQISSIKLCMANLFSVHFMGNRILKEVYQNAGIKVEFIKFPSNRSLIMANEGQCDGEVARIKPVIKKFNNLMIIPTPILEIKSYVYYRKGDVIKTTSWQDLKEKHVGIIRGEIYAEKATKGMNVEAVPDYERLFQLLRIKRIDQAIGLSVPASRVLAIDAKADEIDRLPTPIFKAPLYHLLHKKNVNLIAPIDRVIQAMEKDGRLERAQKRALKELLSFRIKDSE